MQDAAETMNKQIQTTRRTYKEFLFMSAGTTGFQMMRQSHFLKGIDLIKITEEKDRGIIIASNQTYPL